MDPIQRSSVCESLETRRLFSAAFIGHGGALNIVGAPAAAANAIVVENSADGLSFDVTIDWTSKRGVAKHFEASFANTLPFNRIRILGGRGDDVINVGQTNGAIDVNVRVDGKLGNDTINTSDGDDLIIGGRGLDVLNAGAGDDVVHGGKDADTITGGEGNDVLWGGGDDDTIDAGNGDDILGGIVGNNVLHAGAGRDTFRTAVGALTNNPDNDYNPEEDVLVILPPKADADSAKV